MIECCNSSRNYYLLHADRETGVLSIGLANKENAPERKNAHGKALATLTTILEYANQNKIAYPGSVSNVARDILSCYEEKMGCIGRFIDDLIGCCCIVTERRRLHMLVIQIQNRMRINEAQVRSVDSNGSTEISNESDSDLDSDDNEISDEKLENQESKEDAIQRRRSELAKRRENNSEDYPPLYFNELLDNGYIHLFDHLIKMRTFSTRIARENEIEKTPYFTLSHVILEVRDAIIKKVENGIPADQDNVLFLIGGTGAGKSTSLCFLRGDEMQLNNFNYTSTNEKDHLIGHTSNSCTFLPTIEIVKDRVIVDFPGFDDSNGKIVSLGMECALKALIEKYHPKILVLESITNTEGRFAAIAKLGQRLQRILENKQNCVLGLTKYSKDPDFLDIERIEEKEKSELLAQRNAVLLPSMEESVLANMIKELKAVAAGSEISTKDQEQIEKLIVEQEQELAKLQEERLQKQNQPLPELPESSLKVEHRKNIEKKENEMLKQARLKQFIRFDRLGDPTCLSSCFEALSKMEEVNACSQHVIDSEDRKILDKRFLEDLFEIIKTKNKGHVNFISYEDFKQAIMKSSLISIIFAQSNPEIGEFLHLPEMDPGVVQKYDHQVIDYCIDKYMDSIMSIDFSLIKKILNDLNVVQSSKSRLETELNGFRDLVMGLLGVNKDKKTDEEWSLLRKKHLALKKNKDVDFKLPRWVAACLCEPTGKPKGINRLVESYKKGWITRTETIEICCEEITQIRRTLMGLRAISVQLIGFKDKV